MPAVKPGAEIDRGSVSRRFVELTLARRRWFGLGWLVLALAGGRAPALGRGDALGREVPPP
ncbi:MAG: hypothetical protein WAK93_04610, partial [Solirubrobacteraceae bacterium]